MRRAVLSLICVAVATISIGTVSAGAAGVRAEKVPASVRSALEGRWAHFDAVAYEDGILKTLIVSFGFEDLAVKHGRLVDHTTFCTALQRTNQPIETAISDAATQAIRPPVTPLQVDRVDGTVRVHRSATPTPVGIRLADPANQALPTDPNDPRIVDDDGDGKPGITVTIAAGPLQGEIYLARREIFAWDATLTRPGRLVGTVTDTSEQLLIGASNPLFATAASHWVQVTDRTKSPIVLRKVDRSWDCARLKAERERLFGPAPVVDW